MKTNKNEFFMHEGNYYNINAINDFYFFHKMNNYSLAETVFCIHIKFFSGKEIDQALESYNFVERLETINKRYNLNKDLDWLKDYKKMLEYQKKYQDYNDYEKIILENIKTYEYKNKRHFLKKTLDESGEIRKFYPFTENHIFESIWKICIHHHLKTFKNLPETENEKLPYIPDSEKNIYEIIKKAHKVFIKRGLIHHINTVTPFKYSLKNFYIYLEQEFKEFDSSIKVHELKLKGLFLKSIKADIHNNLLDFIHQK